MRVCASVVVYLQANMRIFSVVCQLNESDSDFGIDQGKVRCQSRAGEWRGE